jgi:photosystem II stability/assembly factor-like uncharacterized protein
LIINRRLLWSVVFSICAIVSAIATVAVVFVTHERSDAGCINVLTARELATNSINIDSVLATSSSRSKIYVTTADRKLYIGSGKRVRWHESHTLAPGQLYYSQSTKGETVIAAEQALYRTVNEGRSWQRLSCGLIITGVAMTAYDPRSIYISATNGVGALHAGGLYHTTDGGKSWTRLTVFPGMPSPEPEVNVVVVDPKSSEHVFIGTEYGGIYTSSDSGRHWRFARMSYGGVGVDGPQLTSLAFGPGRRPKIWAGTRASGVFRSDEHGLSWKQSGLGNGSISETVIPDQQRAKLVYALTNMGQVLRSDNNGEKWVPMSGLPRNTDGLSTSTTDGALYAWAGRTVFCSRDHGVTWERLPSLPRG